MRISLIVAMARGGVIGRDGEMPWHAPADLRRFKQLTMGHHLIMGRRTFKSLPRVLDGRLNIVLSRNDGLAPPPEVVIARSLAEGLEVARVACAETGAAEIAIIGGEDVFREVLPQTGRIYLTEVYASPDADTWFPELDDNAWREVFREAHEAGPHDDHAFSFVVLERVPAP